MANKPDDAREDYGTPIEACLAAIANTDALATGERVVNFILGQRASGARGWYYTLQVCRDLGNGEALPRPSALAGEVERTRRTILLALWDEASRVGD